MPDFPVSKLPGWADPQMASVTDPLAVTLLRKAMGLVGADDPTGQVMGAATPTPLTSIFPSKTARIAQLGSPMGPNKKGTFYEMLGMLPEAVQNSLRKFATNYPRVAAHMSPGEETGLPTHIATTHPPMQGPPKAPIPVSYTQTGLQAIADNPQLADNTTWHEGTHVAQTLGLGESNLRRIQTLAGRLLDDPNATPYEIKARLSELTGVDPIDKAMYGSRNANEMLQDWIHGMSRSGINRATGRPLTATDEELIKRLQEIFADRASKGTK